LSGEESGLEKDLEENIPKDSRVQTLLSTLLLERKISLKESRRVVTNKASQSYKSLEKRRFHNGS